MGGYDIITKGRHLQRCGFISERSGYRGLDRIQVLVSGTSHETFEVLDAVPLSHSDTSDSSRQLTMAFAAPFAFRIYRLKFCT
jgi:hypothetical protein